MIPGSDTGGDADADFETIVERVRTQSAEAPGSDTERVTIRSLEGIDADALSRLAEALEVGDAHEAVDPGATGFYLSPQNAERLLETEGAAEFEPLETRLGRPIRVEEGMPDDAVLVMTPEAVDRDDGEVLEPTAIACGTLGTAR